MKTLLQYLAGASSVFDKRQSKGRAVLGRLRHW